MENIESPNITWKFVPRKPDFFKSKKEIIVSVLGPMLKKEPFHGEGVNFFIYQHDCLKLRVFSPKELSDIIKKTVQFYKSPSLTIEVEDESDSGYFCTDSYCSSKENESEARKFLQNITLICCDLYKNNLVRAIQVAVETQFLGRPSSVPESTIDKLKDIFHKNSEHYRFLEKNKEGENFWNGFRYVHNTPWNHYFYNIMSAESLPVRFQCPSYLQCIQGWENGWGKHITHPSTISCEEALAFHINKLMNNQSLLSRLFHFRRSKSGI